MLRVRVRLISEAIASISIPRLIYTIPTRFTISLVFLPRAYVRFVQLRVKLASIYLYNTLSVTYIALLITSPITLQYLYIRLLFIRYYRRTIELLCLIETTTRYPTYKGQAQLVSNIEVQQEYSKQEQQYYRNYRVRGQ